MKQSYTVRIAGIELNLVSDEAEDYVNGLVHLIDQRVNEMMESGRNISRTEAILFCTIDFFDTNCKNALRIERMRDHIAKQEETIAKLTAELAALRGETPPAAEESTAAAVSGDLHE